jgi:soluble lytic murein transglycosylase-like protein
MGRSRSSSGIRGALGALAVAFACAAPAAQAGGIYKWVDSKGVTHYTNVPNDRQTGTGAANLTASAPSSQPLSSRQKAIYKFRDARGVLHYTDRRPERTQNYTVISFYCPACDPKSKVNWGTTKLNLTAYADAINTAAALHGVDPALVRAIVHAESAFNPDALSRKGAQGLMQLIPTTAAMYGVTNSFDPDENIRGGVQHLAGLLKRYNGDIKLAAAAYNAGEGAVQKYGGVPPYEETRVYVDRVGMLHRRYKESATVAATPVAAAPAP